MNTYAQLSLFLPRSFALRIASLAAAVHSAALRGLGKIAPGSAASWRNVDAVDGLDGRMLRDIGAGGWTAARDAQRDRDTLHARLDAEFRG